MIQNALNRIATPQSTGVLNSVAARHATKKAHVNQKRDRGFMLVSLRFLSRDEKMNAVRAFNARVGIE